MLRPLRSPTTSLRRTRVVPLAAVTALVAALAVGGSYAPGRTAAAATGPQDYPSSTPGLSTVLSILSNVNSAFSSAQTTWTSYAYSTVSQVTDVGHNALGALAVQSAGPWSGAASPRFTVDPGARYTATSWVQAATTGHGVGMALRFYDANGTVIRDATQIGQSTLSNTSAWTSTMPAVGFAPPDAVTADVVFVTFDGPAGDVQDVDDVAVSRTTGEAAPVYAPLTTRGTQVLDRYGHPVTLRGVNVDGMEYTRWALVSNRDIEEVKSWGGNFIRIPMSEDLALPNECGYDPSTYLSRIDGFVQRATDLHMITLLDLHTNSLVPCTAGTQQSMPDQRSVTFWKLIAARYKNNPYVAFDLYNEPHGITDKVWRNGGTVVSSGVSYVAPGMQTLYNTVRSTGARNIVIASGNNFATVYPAGAPLTGTYNLVYGVHAYTCPSGTADTGHICYPGPNGVLDPNGILDGWDGAAKTVPLMVTEFGWPDTNDGRYIANVTSSVTAKHWVGWCVYAFTGDTTSLWNLVKDTTSLNPSPAGMAVVNALR